MVDPTEVEGKLAQVRGVLDALHQGLVNDIKTLLSEKAALEAAHAALNTRHDELLAKLKALIEPAPTA